MIFEDKKILITIIVLVLMVLGLGGFIVYDKVLTKKEDSNPIITTIGEKQIDLNALYQIGNTLDNFDKAFNDSNSAY